LLTAQRVYCDRDSTCFERNGFRDSTESYADVVDPVGCGSEIAHGTLPTFPPPVPRQIINARIVGLVPDKGHRPWYAERRVPKREPRPCDLRPRGHGVSGTLTGWFNATCPRVSPGKHTGAPEVPVMPSASLLRRVSGLRRPHPQGRKNLCGRCELRVLRKQRQTGHVHSPQAWRLLSPGGDNAGRRRRANARWRLSLAPVIRSSD
jgi:hypothetical protein